MHVILEVIASQQADQVGQRFAFERHEAFVVGRKKNARVQFRIPTDPYLSRFHFLVEVSPPRCFLRDLGSRNGTRVNGRRVRTAELKDGDVIHGGRTKMRVQIETAEPLAPAVAPPAADDGPTGEPTCATPAVRRDQIEDTTLFGRVSPIAGREVLRCASCQAVAEDTQLSALADSRIIAYVCPDCHGKHHTAERPIPNYETLQPLSHGALGPVVKARRISDGRIVVLKMLSPQIAARPEAVRLFLRQMSLVAGLQHPRLVSVVEMGQAGSDLWIAHRYVDGVDARRLVEQSGAVLPLADAVGITCQVLEALHYAHGRSLVHRDVKPSNIVVAGQPGSYQAYLTDFGLMKNVDEAGVSGYTVAGDFRGSLPFTPPEQILDARFVKAAGDIYAAGATLYWLLTGRYVYDFDAKEDRGRQKDPYLLIVDDREPIVPLRDRDPSIPASLARTIETALAYDPEDRFESAHQMAQSLQTALVNAER